jgi:hypothetical protein
LTNCCGVSPLRLFPPSRPASWPPELEDPLLEEPLPELEELPLEEPVLPDPEEPPLEELLLPVDPEKPDELPASVVCASWPEVEPHAVAVKEAEINPHQSMRRMFTSFGRSLRA